MSVAGINSPIISTFMDDLKIIEAKNFGIISQVKKELTATFEMADIESISFYFNLKVSENYEKKIIKLSKLAYIDKILAKFYLFQANTSNISIKETPLQPIKKEVIAAKREHY